MLNYRSLLGCAGPAAALGIFLAGPAALAQAPQSAQTPANNMLAVAAAPAWNLGVPAYSSSSSSSSSSSNSSMNLLSEARANLSSAAMDAAQPPPRRRYGRPNYSDSHTNPDGSSKWAFMAGGGAAVPMQDMSNYDTPSWTFQGGFGRNWSQHLGMLLQFDYAHFGLQGSVLGNQQNLYNTGCTPQQQSAGNCQLIVGLDGNSHIWSFTLDPTYTFYASDTGKTGAYVVGGVGFYHKVTNFTIPQVQQYCSFYYYGYCTPYQANVNFDHYTSNAVGFNGGVGLTYKFSHFASERLYTEVRYVFVDNQPRNRSFTNFYPPNANRSYYIPVTVGLRF
jgi:hypothetical protein